MGYGYSLLPTADDPVSTMTFRLTPSEKRERDEWILGALEHGISISEIAYEVGLTVQRVKEIIKKTSPEKIPGRKIGKGKFKTPKDAAMHDYWTNKLCEYCRKGRSRGLCNDCFSFSLMEESCYDENGQPIPMYMGEETLKYIEQAQIVTVDTEVVTFGIKKDCHDIGFKGSSFGWGHSHSLCKEGCDCYPGCQSENFIVFRQGPKIRPGAAVYFK